MNMWLDIEQGMLYTTEQLEQMFNELKKEQPEEYDYSFYEYLKSCSVRENGTLERVLSVQVLTEYGTYPLEL